MAETLFGTPAVTAADPLSTARAVPEVRLDLFHDFQKDPVGRRRRVMCVRAAGAACHGHNGTPEFREKSVAAAIAEKFELVTAIGGMVCVFPS
jgi:hypothetical protein